MPPLRNVLYSIRRASRQRSHCAFCGPFRLANYTTILRGLEVSKSGAILHKNDLLGFFFDVQAFDYCSAPLQSFPFRVYSPLDYFMDYIRRKGLPKRTTSIAHRTPLLRNYKCPILVSLALESLW